MKTVELTERKKKILKAIVSTYLETGEPVGSRTISKYTDLKLSSATIRNEMADLEELGYILQPHTSAGRVPSDLGYRFFVDQLMSEKENEIEEKQALIERVDRMEVLLKQVARTLASNTNYATLVTAPQYKESTIKFIQISQVDEGQILAVIVIGANIIKNHLIQTNTELRNDEVLKLNLLINSFLQGLSLTDINLELMYTMKVQAGIHADLLEQVFMGIVEAIHEVDDVEIYTEGASNMLKYPELGDRKRATLLLEKLADKDSLAELIDKTSSQDEDGDKKVQVYIGSESNIQDLKDCSIVTVPYDLGKSGSGTIGIIGPKRMNYKKVVKTLQNLTEELDVIFGNDKK